MKSGRCLRPGLGGPKGPEEWRACPDHEGLYEASSLGRIRNRHGRVLKPGTDKDGYPMLTLAKNGQQRAFILHRLICRAFHGEQPNPLHKEVCHLDGNRKNAAASNLRWVGRVENNFHKRAHGTHPSGERNPRAKLSAEQVSEIRRRALSGERPAALAAEFGISPSYVGDIRRGRRWASLPHSRLRATRAIPIAGSADG